MEFVSIYKDAPQGLLNAAEVMPSWQVELLKVDRSRIGREIAPQGLKPSLFAAFTARLKSCPDTKRFLILARNRLTQTLVLQAPIAGEVGFQDLQVAMNDHKDVPQGLKPSCRVTRCGTAEAVPFVQGIFPSEHGARKAGVETADLSTTLPRIPLELANIMHIKERHTRGLGFPTQVTTR